MTLGKNSARIGYRPRQTLRPRSRSARTAVLARPMARVDIGPFGTANSIYAPARGLARGHEPQAGPGPALAPQSGPRQSAGTPDRRRTSRQPLLAADGHGLRHGSAAARPAGAVARVNAANSSCTAANVSVRAAAQQLGSEQSFLVAPALRCECAISFARRSAMIPSHGRRSARGNRCSRTAAASKARRQRFWKIIFRTPPHNC